MEGYLLKSAACLAIFLVFYKLFLERENMHIFKRFYLLVSLLLALLIPLLTFTTYVEASAKAVTITEDASPALLSETSENIFAWSTLVWSIYFLGVAFFSVLFLKNLFLLLQKIKKNEKLKTQQIIHVLLNHPTTPHTFFQYIFLNKQKFEASQIPEEVMLHEKTHALQKHSWDVLCIEVIQIVFWFQPFIYFFKHAIKLNHEFLADRAVLNKGVDSTTYQHLLLAFSSNASAPLLANSINYSSIKKRFTVMKTHTSKKAIWLRCLLLLPMLILVLYGFSNQQVRVKEPVTTQTAATAQQKATPLEIKEYNRLAKKLKKQTAKNTVDPEDVERIHYLYSIMSEEQRQKAAPLPNIAVNTAPQTSDLQDRLQLIAKMTAKNAAFYYEGQPISSERARTLVEQNDDLSILANPNTQPPQVKISKFPVQVEASKEQLEEYEQLAKTYRGTNKNGVVRKRDQDRLEYLYSAMTPQQRSKAAPYPEFPEPPAPPAPPAPPQPASEVDDFKIYPPLPPPQTNPDLVKYIHELAKKGATFYIGPHEYTADEAILLVQKSKNPSIDVSKYPIVKLNGC